MIDFTGGDRPMRLGLEIEYWVIDQRGALAGAGAVPDDYSFVEQEVLESVIEVKTEPHDSVEGVRAELLDRLARVRRRLEREGKRLAPLGTSLVPPEVDANADDRVDAQRRLLGEAFDDVIACAGTHVHVEQREPAAQLNALTALDPAIALVNTTSYHAGRRLAACARPCAYRRRGYAGFPELGQLWRYAADADAWRRRLRDRFERFRRAALEAGVPEDVVETHFEPSTAVWAPVRLRDDLGTVEWRAPDAALPSQVCRLLADVAGVLECAASEGVVLETNRPGIEEAVRLPPFDRLRALTDRAITRGIAAPAVRAYLTRFGIDVAAYAPGGWQGGPPRLSRRQARTRRQRRADLLERDLQRLVREEHLTAEYSALTS